MKHATLLFLLKDDQILLAMKKRGFGEGRWNGVGGKVEPDETIEEALIRECQEEINVTPTDFYKAAEVHYDEFKSDVPYNITVHVFCAIAWKGKPTESEEMAPQWFLKSRMPLQEMWPDDPYWLPQILEGKKLTAYFSLDLDDQLIEHSVTFVNNL